MTNPKFYLNLCLTLGILNLNAKKMEGLIIPLSPLEIQQKIVEEIEAIEKTEKSIERLEGVMMKYLT